MRIAIDCRWIFPKISGIGKHTENLTRGLSEIDRHNHYLLLKDPLVSYGLFSLANQIRLPKLLKRLDVDIYHSTNFMIPLFLSRKIKVVVTIHDLIPFKFPQYTPHAKKTKFNWLFKLIIKKVIKRADMIIAVSNTTANDIVECFGVPKDKIKVVYNGISPEFFSKRKQNTDNGYTPPPKTKVLVGGYILFVGRQDPYKNLTGLIHAYAKLLNDYGITEKLLIVGKKDPRYPEVPQLVDKLNLKDNVEFYGYVNSKELLKLYQNASLLVLPSLYEGFGMPPIEAMACGVPVVVSNTPALVETVNDKAIVTDPSDANKLADSMYKVITDKSLREKLSQDGKIHAQKFTIENMAKETLKVYESCVNT